MSELAEFLFVPAARRRFVEPGVELGGVHRRHLVSHPFTAETLRDFEDRPRGDTTISHGPDSVLFPRSVIVGRPRFAQEPIRRAAAKPRRWLVVSVPPPGIGRVVDVTFTRWAHLGWWKQ